MQPLRHSALNEWGVTDFRGSDGLVTFRMENFRKQYGEGAVLTERRKVNGKIIGVYHGTDVLKGTDAALRQTCRCHGFGNKARTYRKK